MSQISVTPAPEAERLSTLGPDPEVSVTAGPSDEARRVYAMRLRQALAQAEAQGYAEMADEYRAVAEDLAPLSLKTLPAE